MTGVEDDRRLLYRQLYKGRRRDLEIHTYADVRDVYKVYAPVWGQWGKMLWTYPEEMVIRRRRSKATFSPDQAALLAKMNQSKRDTVEVVSDPLSGREAPAPLSARSQADSLKALVNEVDSETEEEKKVN